MCVQGGEGSAPLITWLAGNLAWYGQLVVGCRAKLGAIGGKTLLFSKDLEHYEYELLVELIP